MRRFFLETQKLIHKNLKSLVLFEVLYKSVFFLLMVPLISWSLQKMLRLSGYSYLTIENITSFLKSPFTLIYAFFLIGLLSFFVTIEIIALIIYCYSSIQKRKISVTQIIYPSLYKSFQLFRNKKNRLMPLYSLLEGFIICVPMIYSIISNMRSFSYVITEIFQYKGILFTFIFLLLVLFIVMFRGIFTIHFCVLEGKTFKEGYYESKKIVKGNAFQIFRYLFFWNIIIGIVSQVLYFIVILTTGIIVYLTMSDAVVVVVFLRFLEQISVYVIMFISIFTFIANYGLITKLFVTYKNEKRKTGYEIEKLQEKISDAVAEERLEKNVSGVRSVFAKGRYFRLVLLVTVIAIVFHGYYLFTGFYRNAFIETDSLFGTYVTAHRGASKIAPENTMVALSAAIESFADFAEIDVQETKDGVVVLMHDTSLHRTCGVEKNIWEVTYEELSTYDAGSYFSKDFTGEKVPTLEEVLAFCKDKIKLNIEIKVTTHQQNLMEKVVTLIEQYGFERQCVITSANYSALARVKELNNSIKTGYILSLAYGYFYDKEYADFFSVKSSFINESMVRMSHSLGKEIHGWTINNTTEIERMKQLGVDNIITDDPFMARDILYSESSIATFKELLETLIK